MGLDMYVYKVKKPNFDSGKVYDRAKLMDHMILSAYDAATDLYKQLAPYAQKLRVINRYYNIKKIREDFHMPDADISMISSDAISISGTVGGVEATRTITTEQIDTLYTVNHEEECFVLALENVAYWRNKSDLEDFVYDSLSECVENLGFYLLDEKTVEIINQYCAQHDPAQSIEWYKPTDTSALFYHEWY